MARGKSPNIPQILTITRISAEGKLALAKAVRQHLDLADSETLRVRIEDEIQLSSEGEEGIEVAVSKQGRLALPQEALEKLGITERSLVALIERPGAVAVKRAEIVEVEGERPRIADVETPYVMTRKVETNPTPEALLSRLRESCRGQCLRHDVMGFLAGRQTLEAWKARRLLERVEPADAALREALIRDRLAQQAEDGSWAGDVILTARRLRELAELGETCQHDSVRRAVDWLLTRPQSPYNPGMFFAADELVEEQTSIVESREAGQRGRFRMLLTSEKKRVMAGDDVICAPCGPRIMWPNALVLEALLALGCEGHERVQTALRTMRFADWCECGYQHGPGRGRRGEPLGAAEIAGYERACTAAFRYGTFTDLQQLARLDAPRVSHRPVDGADEYLLDVRPHIQGCEFITTRAMSRVRDQRMRRFAEAHLWRFAGRQQEPDGRFASESYGSGLTLTGMLEAFARYDHPASRIVILRSIPWILETQNEDGSWGEQAERDTSTLAVVAALVRAQDDLPPGFFL